MDYSIEFSHIGKVFPGVRALDDVSFRASGGKVTALLGENGAGKSTLLKILSGDLRPDSGTVIICGEEKKLMSPRNAIDSGISVIYQERQLVPTMTVMENVFLEDIPRSRLGFVKRAEMREKTQELIDLFELPVSPAALAGKLSVAHQQMIEIMKAFRRNSSVIAFDEPTAPLTDSETRVLFRLIQRLRGDGKVILYVSHRLAEIFALTDEIAVLKDGALVKTFATAETNEQELIKSMVGRDIGDTYSHLRRNDNIGEIVLEVKDLTTNLLNGVSFSVRRGEIIGFAGLVGAGRTETMRAIFGSDPIKSGEILLKGERVRFASPKDAIDGGIALCPEDRKEQGLVLQRSISDNISMPVLRKVKIGPVVSERKEHALASEAVESYGIKTPTVEKITMELSGGNQQKVILGRWTSKLLNTDVLILDEPTKGIDVSTKAEIYQMICNFACDGKAVIFISSELTEVLNISDNIIVMNKGRVTGTVSRSEATEEAVLALAMAE
jgi:ABC-type sugar transport system ATPase subunit